MLFGLDLGLDKIGDFFSVRRRGDGSGGIGFARGRAGGWIALDYGLWGLGSDCLLLGGLLHLRLLGKLVHGVQHILGFGEQFGAKIVALLLLLDLLLLLEILQSLVHALLAGGYAIVLSLGQGTVVLRLDLLQVGGLGEKALRALHEVLHADLPLGQLAGDGHEVGHIGFFDSFLVRKQLPLFLFRETTLLDQTGLYFGRLVLLSDVLDERQQRLILFRVHLGLPQALLAILLIFLFEVSQQLLLLL